MLGTARAHACIPTVGWQARSLTMAACHCSVMFGRLLIEVVEPRVHVARGPVDNPWHRGQVVRRHGLRDLWSARAFVVRCWIAACRIGAAKLADAKAVASKSNASKRGRSAVVPPSPRRRGAPDPAPDTNTDPTTGIISYVSQSGIRRINLA